MIAGHLSTIAALYAHICTNTVFHTLYSRKRVIYGTQLTSMGLHIDGTHVVAITWLTRKVSHIQFVYSSTNWLSYIYTKIR